MDIEQTEARLVKLVDNYGNAKYTRGYVSHSEKARRSMDDEVALTRHVLLKEIKRLITMAAAGKAVSLL